MRFDLLIKGGEVVDPGGGKSGRLDVAIKRNRIAAVDADIPAETAFRVVDAGGQYVTPGLVDLHTHVNYGCGFYGIRPDPIAARSGVTTWLDVGSSGGYNFTGFRQFIIENSHARIYALLNISSIGLTAQTWELANPGYCDVDLCCQIIDLNRDVLLGVKARIDQLTTSGQGLAPLHKAREAADRCELPLMTHIGMGPPGIDGVMALMRPGDILTHCFTGGTMRICRGFRRPARDGQTRLGCRPGAGHRPRRGVLLIQDRGGADGTGLPAGRDLLRHPSDERQRPDVRHAHLPEQIHDAGHEFFPKWSTPPPNGRRPCWVWKRRSARCGPARWRTWRCSRSSRGDFMFYDVFMNPRPGRQLVRNTLTIINGREMAHQSDDPLMPWIELSEAQQTLIAEGHTPSVMAACCKH